MSNAESHRDVRRLGPCPTVPDMTANRRGLQEGVL
jgi:hypothetical protein